MSNALAAAQIHVTITTGADGKAASIAHDIEGVASPLPRIADLPADWAAKRTGGSQPVSFR